MISLVVMLISVLVIFKITNRFGLQLKLKPLLLCAFCAFWINLFTLFISPYLMFSHLGLIFVSVLGSACAVTFYNEKLTTLKNDSDALEIQKSTHIIKSIEKFSSATTENNIKKEENISVIDLAKVPVAEIPDEMRIITESNSLERLDEKEQIEKEIESTKKQRLSEELEKLNSLDEILDYAYEQKEHKQYVNSLFAFKQALKKYSNDEYAPFIIIEMGNIYKNIGFYDEALNIYARAFSLPYVAVNDVVKEKFQREITYLRVIKVILLEHNCSKKPFNQIPQFIMQKIEVAFQHCKENINCE